jgi:hypothetical protein|tara:strand:+ start:633 stop:1208 length:576 start_codon:yes stop_codon:yes gene_type:complete
MVIIRRNPDGSIASQEGGVNMNTPSHPALATKRGMQALADAGRPVSTLMNEIATKVNNAKDKPRKLKVLKDHDSVPLRQVLKGAFDPKIEWLLPKGDDIPYNKNDAPIGTEHTLLSQEAKRLYLFTKGGDNTLSQNKRETLFIQMLEGLSAQEADFLVTVVNKKVNNKYKGFTANLVKEAFDWNDDFMKKE